MRFTFIPEIFETLYWTSLLPPFFTNIKKQLIKSPKNFINPPKVFLTPPPY